MLEVFENHEIFARLEAKRLAAEARPYNASTMARKATTKAAKLLAAGGQRRRNFRDRYQELLARSVSFPKS